MTKEEEKKKEGKMEALSVALSQIEKDYGKGAIMKISEGARVQIDAVPTGSLALDLALGIGGLLGLLGLNLIVRPDSVELYLTLALCYYTMLLAVLLATSRKIRRFKKTA